MKKSIFLLLLFLMQLTVHAQVNAPIVLGYFPSWSETWVSANQDSPLRRIPSYVNYVFLSFAKPDMTYTAGSYDISGTGINVPYDGCTLKESVSALNNKGVKVILSIGGETYWGDPNVYSSINYLAIKALVDDMGFAGIDWDFEPNGSFANIGSPANVQHFIDFFTQSRAVMPVSGGYILACAPSGVGALGGQTNDDAGSPFKYANRNALTGETDGNLYNGTVATNGINLFGFSATGHMIPVFQAVGSLIDIVAYQGYNCGGSTNRQIMYDSYAHYAEQYGFHVAAGVHYPNEPWGPYYTYTHQNVASLSEHIRTYPQRIGDHDGVMIWQLLMAGTGSSAYSYLNVASQVLNGTATVTAVSNANTYSMQPYTGGAQGCGSGTGTATLYCGYAPYNAANAYPTPNTIVYHNCNLWKNQWYANAGEVPGSNTVWIQTGSCAQGPGCSGCTPPSITSVNGASRCGSGTATIYASSSTGTVSWYASSTATPAIATGTAYTTPSLSMNTTYYVDATDAGCTTPVRTAVTVTVNAIPVLTVTASNASICSGASATLTASGATTYTWLPSGSGTNITVNPSSTAVYTVNGSNGACSGNQKTVTITVNAAPVLTVTTSNTSICSGASATLTASGATTYTWLPSGSGTNITVNPSSTTVYTVNGSIGACSGTQKTVTITVNASPVLTVTASNTSICSGASATLTASGATTYTWLPSGSGTNITVNPSSTTVYTVNGSNGACTGTQKTVTITVNTAPVLTVTTSNTSICSGASATLTASGATTYTWLPSGSGTNITVNPSSTTVYTVNGSNGACSGTQKTVTITVNASPVLTVTASNTSICSGASATLTASGATTYTWLPSGSGTNITVTPSSTTVYTVNGSNGACTSTQKTVTITVNTAPVLTVTTSNTSICSGASATLTASGATTYTWLPSGSGTNIIVNPSSTTVYTVNGSNGACTGTQKTVTITVNAAPVLTVTASNTSICSGASATLTASGATTYTWLPTTGLSGATGSVVIASPASSVIYTVTGSNSTCETAQTIPLSVVLCVGIEDLAANSHLVVYPNPSNGLFTISTPGNAGKLDVEVLNTLGQAVMKQSSKNPQTLVVDMSGYSRGVYYLKVQLDSGTKLVKVVLE